MKFRIPSTVTSISECKLNLYEQWDSRLSANSKIRVSEILQEDDITGWYEYGMNWKNQVCGSDMHTFNSKCSTTAMDEVLISDRYQWYQFDVTEACQNALARGDRYVGLVLYAWTSEDYIVEFASKNNWGSFKDPFLSIV